MCALVYAMCLCRWSVVHQCVREPFLIFGNRRFFANIKVVFDCCCCCCSVPSPRFGPSEWHWSACTCVWCISHCEYNNDFFVAAAAAATTASCGATSRRCKNKHNHVLSHTHARGYDLLIECENAMNLLQRDAHCIDRSGHVVDYTVHLNNIKN